MNNTIRVRVIEGGTDLDGNINNPVEFSGTCLRKAWTIHQLHDKERLALRLAYIVYGDNMGMVESGSGAGFAQQTLARIGRRRCVRQNFDRDFAHQFEVCGAVDNTHSTAANFAVEPITLAQHRSGSNDACPDVVPTH